MVLEKEFNKDVVKIVSKEDREVIALTLDELVCRYLGFSNNPELFKERYFGKECYVGSFANEDGSFGIKFLRSKENYDERPQNLKDFFDNKMIETELGISMVSEGTWDNGREIRCSTTATVSQTIKSLRKVTDEYKNETKVETIKEIVKLFDRYLSDSFKKLTPVECDEAAEAIKNKLPQMGIKLVVDRDVKSEHKSLIDSKQNKI